MRFRLLLLLLGSAAMHTPLPSRVNGLTFAMPVSCPFFTIADQPYTLRHFGFGIAKTVALESPLCTPVIGTTRLSFLQLIWACPGPWNSDTGNGG